MVARFDDQKDQLTLVRSLAKVPCSNWTLEFVGDGPLKSMIVREVDSLGLNEKIEFSGTRYDVAQRLSTSDIFILSTKWEGLPLSILEAMSAELPVIASNVGGIPEIVVNDHTGFVVAS